MRLETGELLTALTPFLNGCKFKLIFKANGEVVMKFGCYLLSNLQTGSNQYLQELIARHWAKNDWDKELILNQHILVENINHVKLELLKITITCTHCEQILHEEIAHTQNNK